MSVNPADLARPDWTCVHFADSAPDASELAGNRIEPVAIDGATIGNDSAMFEALSEGFGFPDWFGRNWDAVNDCLQDLEWLPAENYALVVSGAESLWADAPRTAAGLVGSWQFAAESWAGLGVGFHLIFEW